MDGSCHVVCKLMSARLRCECDRFGEHCWSKLVVSQAALWRYPLRNGMASVCACCGHLRRKQDVIARVPGLAAHVASVSARACEGVRVSAIVRMCACVCLCGLLFCEMQHLCVRRIVSVAACVAWRAVAGDMISTALLHQRVVLQTKPETSRLSRLRLTK